MLLGVLLLFLLGVSWGGNPLVDNNRPLPGRRLFNSTSIEKILKEIVPKMVDQDLALLFVDCLPNTLDTTVYYNGNDTNPDTFLITGDIHAMWLRDSSGQVSPYVQFVNEDPHLKAMIKGLIKRQMSNILIDSYANAFNNGPTGSPWDSDTRTPKMSPYLWEGKYEIDSLAWVLRLVHNYYNYSKDDSICTPDFFNAIARILATVKYQQQQITQMSNTDSLYYSFERDSNEPSETLQFGTGGPTKRCGLSRTGFRPSDSAGCLPFLIPGNMLMSVGLHQMSQILSTRGKCKNPSLALQTAALSDEIENGIKSQAIISHKKYGQIYAYEVDGYGGQYLIDDANIPSLLSLPYIGYVDASDPTYQNTRSLLLSYDNPYWFCGTAGCGIGSSHTGMNYIWHMSIVMRALTSTNDNEIRDCLTLLKNSTDNTFFLHESFQKDSASDFTRSWFAWVNSMFGELIIKLSKERPYILFGNCHNGTLSQVRSS